MRKSGTDLHWNARATGEVDPAKVNIADTVQRDLELDFILENLDAGARLLEIGCGNGYVTRILRERVAQVDAFDYAENMVRRAVETYGETNNRFFHDNILEPKHVRPPYDIALCVRVLINLRDLHEQERAVERIAALLRAPGKLILVEGFIEGFTALSALRTKSGLPPLAPARINFYSRLSDLLPTIERHFVIERRFHTGMFDLLTRVVYPALVGAENADGPADFHRKILPVARAYNSDAMEPIARVHAFVLRKK